TPDQPEAEVPTQYPAYLGFDHMESFFVDFEAKPNDAITGRLSVNILGNVPVNPINEIFYENRGRARSILGNTGEFILPDVERVKVYQAEINWDDRWFNLNAFYRTGHLHWQYEGDFFGMYHDAYYGENIDIYNGMAPIGLEIAGKKAFNGLKIAYGPELWWAANPTVFVKYNRRLWKWDVTAIYQDDFAQKSPVTATSTAIPMPATRKLSLQLEGSLGNFVYQVGGIWAGEPLVGRTFQIAEPEGDSYRILQDTVKDSDTFGGKAKITYQNAGLNWYAQGATMGIVANGGPTAIPTFTGWRLRDSGLGNQTNFLTGLALQAGNFQFSPNFLWQLPMVGPIPGDVPAPGRPRNVIEDPFAVRANREMRAAEILVTYDPTPATWMWQWDNDTREDAGFAAAVGYVYRHLLTTQDVSIFISEEGIPYPFAGAPPAQELWEVWGRIISAPSPNIRFIADFYTGPNEANGFDPSWQDLTLNRRIMRRGVNARLAWGQQAYEVSAKFNDWGPYDYHRDFNLTYPLQLTADVSHTLGLPRWYGYPQTRFGVRLTWRSLDENSPRYCPGKTPDALGDLECDPTLDGPNGTEWEFRTYLHFSM
ncbi:MAG: glycosidase, partial [Candidatus Latescibacterota bacterium]